MTTAPTTAIDDLLALPLFADVDKKLLEAVRKEAAITAGTFEWAAGTARRPGFVTFRALAAGDTAISQGDLGNEFVIVLQGRIEAIAARAGREPHRHRTYGPGDWFGEVSAHSHHPALASYRALEACAIATFDARLFSKLYAEDDEWKQRIDEGYRDNLGLHLRASLLCRDLDDQALATLQQQAELITVEDGDVLAKAGDPADKVWLVRAGAIACRVRSDRGERDLAFYKGNATLRRASASTTANSATDRPSTSASVRLGIRLGRPVPLSARRRSELPGRSTSRSAVNTPAPRGPPARASRAPSPSITEISVRRACGADSRPSSSAGRLKLPTMKPSSRPARSTGMHRSSTSTPLPSGSGTK